MNNICVSCRSQEIFEELMLHFYESPKKILGFLEILSEYDSNHRGKFITQEQIVSILIIILRLFNTEQF